MFIIIYTVCLDSVNPNINLKTPETYKKFISNEASKVAQSIIMIKI